MMDAEKYTVDFIRSRGFLLSANVPDARVLKAARMVVDSYFSAPAFFENSETSDKVDDAACALILVDVAQSVAFATRTGGEKKNHARGSHLVGQDNHNMKATAAMLFRRACRDVGVTGASPCFDYLAIFVSNQFNF